MCAIVRACMRAYVRPCMLVCVCAIAHACVSAYMRARARCQVLMRACNRACVLSWMLSCVSLRMLSCVRAIVRACHCVCMRAIVHACYRACVVRAHTHARACERLPGRFHSIVSLDHSIVFHTLHDGHHFVPTAHKGMETWLPLRKTLIYSLPLERMTT